MRQIENINDAEIINDGGRWFVIQNVDYSDEDGNMGMSSEYLCSPHGYETQAEAEAALAQFEQAA